MSTRQYFKSNIFKIRSTVEFEKLTLELFRYQASNNIVYAEYLNNLNIDAREVETVEGIPFLPIRFFKSHKIISTNRPAELNFFSSGTTGNKSSEHLITDRKLYESSFRTAYGNFIGDPAKQCIIALLPSYLDREGSSLVYMINELINLSNDEESGFYLKDLQKLHEVLMKKLAGGKNVVLWGVTFALLELAEKFPANLHGLTIIETGGMKGRGKELVREEVQQRLCDAFNLQVISSEYGMTELLSQAYAMANGRFNCPPWMRVCIRNVNDPFTQLSAGRTGGINVIDLANIDSCAFIETEDLGRLHPNKSFEVLGRYDNSDIRGCNLLAI